MLFHWSHHPISHGVHIPPLPYQPFTLFTWTGLVFGMLSDRTEGATQVFVDFFAEKMGDNLGKVEVVRLD